MGAAGVGAAVADPASGDAASGAFAGLLAALEVDPAASSGAAVLPAVAQPQQVAGLPGATVPVAGAVPLQEGMTAADLPGSTGPDSAGNASGLPAQAKVPGGPDAAAAGPDAPEVISPGMADLEAGYVQTASLEAALAMAALMPPVPVQPPVPAAPLALVPEARAGVAAGETAFGAAGSDAAGPAGPGQVAADARPSGSAPTTGASAPQGPQLQMPAQVTGMAQAPGMAQPAVKAAALAFPVAQPGDRDETPTSAPAQSAAAAEAPAGEAEAAPVLTAKPVPTMPGSWETQVPEPGKDGTSRFFAAPEPVDPARLTGKSGATAEGTVDPREPVRPVALAQVQAQAQASDAADVNPLFARLAEAVGGAFTLKAEVMPAQSQATQPVQSGNSQTVPPAQAAVVPAGSGPDLLQFAMASTGPNADVEAVSLQEPGLDVADPAPVLVAGAATQAAKVAPVRAPNTRSGLASEASLLAADPDSTDLAELQDRSPLANRLAAAAEGQFMQGSSLRGTAGADAASAGSNEAAARLTGQAAAGSSRGEAPALAIAMEAAAAAAEFGESLSDADAMFGARGATPMTRAEAQAANLPGPQMAQAAAAQVAAQMQQQARPGQSRFQIRLDPAELGRIDVEMTVTKDGEVKAKLTVDKSETLDLFMRDQRSLERALEAAGLKAEQGSLQFSLRDEGGRSFSFSGEGSDHNGSRQQGGDGQSAEADASQAERLASERVAQLYRGNASGGLDIRI
ncbi:flagellar hook-length control protein FliK [Pannonibacter carbonis]|uniref:flagellar hook-length control protein FliK n=1 Tax=Pannonibacter carbonis TaxID=2067569 RepID=UPI0013003632|nr:flagellar hook-length control protein FliK [Pannonibacter carbonis]